MYAGCPNTASTGLHTDPDRQDAGSQRPNSQKLAQGASRGTKEAGANEQA